MDRHPWGAMIAGQRLRIPGRILRPRQPCHLLVAVLALVCMSPSAQAFAPTGGDARLAALAARPIVPSPGPPRVSAHRFPRAPSTRPPRFVPVVVRQPRVRVDAVRPGATAEARKVEGVAFVTMVRIGRVKVGPATSRWPALRVAAVDPGEFRVLTPQPTADAVGLWQRVAVGGAAFRHEWARTLSLKPGRHLPMGDGVPVQVAALATNTAPPLADAIVNASLGRRLGLTRVPPTLLVAVREGTSPYAVARQLERRLGGRAQVIPDPRAPRRVFGSTGDSVWDRLALCESSGDWHANTGNGYYGGLQFLPESWYLVGGTGLPHEASREEQIYRAQLLLAIQGWKAWPACSLALGLRKPTAEERAAAAAQPASDDPSSPSAAPSQSTTSDDEGSNRSQPSPGEPTPSPSSEPVTKLTPAPRPPRLPPLAPSPSATTRADAGQ